MVKGRWNQRKEVFEKEISTQTAGKSRKGQRNSQQEKSNLYPNGQEKQKRVEKFTADKIKSLPKRLGKAEMGREIHIRKNQISTKTAGKANKGRESHTGSQKISTQVNKISKKGRTTITE